MSQSLALKPMLAVVLGSFAFFFAIGRCTRVGISGRALVVKQTDCSLGRGLELDATTDLARAIVDFLAARLADHAGVERKLRIFQRKRHVAAQCNVPKRRGQDSNLR